MNFPVGSKRYAASSPFAYDADMVHTIHGCIDVLEGRQYQDLTQKDALRWLVHLVGDIHQPLQVVAGYYDLAEGADAKLEKTVAEINREATDLGSKPPRLTVRFKANNDLSPTQRKAIEKDFAMVRGVGVLRVRKAVLLYTLNYLGLNDPSEPQVRRLALARRATFRPSYRPKA